MPRNRPVDVLVDSLEMCHRFEFADRLATSSPTLPLAELLLSKLQVVKINRKDVLDALVLLAEHPLGQDDGAPDSRHGLGAINVPRILSFTSNDWGWWRTVTGNLDTLDQYLAVELTPEDLDLNNGRAVLFDPGAQVAALRDGHRRRPEVDALEAPRAGRRAPDLVPGARGDGAQLMRIFFATDIHGSEVCWRKFLNAGKFHKADVLIMGGDMTGKAMVPIVANGSNWELELQGQRHVLTTEDELRAMEKRISDRGYYPVRLTRDEVDAWAADADARRRPVQGGDARQRSSAGWRSATSGWPGPGIRCIVSPANDDMFEIDPIIERARASSSSARANTIALDGFTLVSTGWANPTPWNTFRELPEPELRERIDGLVAPGPRSAPGDLQLPRPAVRLEPRQRAEARRRHELRVGRPGARSRSARRPSASRSSPTARRSRSTATSTRARARSSSARPWRSTPAARTRTASSRRPSSTSTRRRAR